LAYQRLGLAYRQGLADDGVRDVRLLLGRQAEQRARVTHFDIAVFEHALHVFAQRHQPQQVGHGGARLADRIGDLLVREFEFLLQARQRHRLLHRIEVFTLDVFDQRHGDGGFVRYLANHDRYLVETGQLAGAPAAFAGDDLVAVGANWSHHDGLHDTLCPDRVGEFFQRFLIHVAARLVFAALDEFDRQLSQLTVLAGGSGSAVGSARSIAGRVIRRDLFGGG